MAESEDDEPRPAHRPSGYKEEYNRVAQAMAKLGATDREIGESLGVSDQTIKIWCRLHPKFFKAMCIGNRAANDRVKRSLYHRAIGYSYDAVKIFNNDGMPLIVNYVEHVPPDVHAATLWLTNLDKKMWANRQYVSTPPGETLDVRIGAETLLAEFARRAALVASSVQEDSAAVGGDDQRRPRLESGRDAGESRPVLSPR